MAQTHFLAIPNKDLISSFTFNYYGTRLAVSSLDHHIYILSSDPSTGKWPEDQSQGEEEAQQPPINNNPISIDAPPSSRKSSPLSSIQAWTAHEGPVIKVIWSDPIHGEILASAGTDGTVRIWEEDARRMDYSTGGTTRQESQGKGSQVGSLSSGGWYQRTVLADSNRAIRDIGFSASETSLRLASISSDHHLRVYECLEGGGSFSCDNWSLLININLERLPPNPSSHNDHLNPAIPTNSTPTPAPPATAAAAAAAQPSNQSPFTSVRGFDPSVSLNTLKSNKASTTTTLTGGGSNFNLINPLSGIRSSTKTNNNNSNSNNNGSSSTEHMEAFGGWALSWCPESYWGDMLAVSAGTQGHIRLFTFKPHSQWDNFAVLDPASELDSASHRHPATSPKQTAGVSNGNSSSGGGGTTTTTTTNGGLAVCSLAWAPACGRDYHLIAAGHRDGRARIWKGLLTPADPSFYLDTELDHHLVVPSSSSSSSLLGVAKCHWNLTGTVLSTSANDGKVRIWKMGYTSRWVNTAEISCVHDPRGTDDEDNTNLIHQSRPSASSAAIVAAHAAGSTITSTTAGHTTNPNPILLPNGIPTLDNDHVDASIIIG